MNVEFSLKLAMTLDGKIATQSGESKWITSSEARQRVMAIRREHQAILTGINTVIQDDPSLTVRNTDGHVDNPPNWRRIVLDTHGRIPNDSQLLTDPYAQQTLVFGGEEFPVSKRDLLESLGLSFVATPKSEEGLDVAFISDCLSKMGIHKVLVESGGEVAASFLNANLISRCFFFYAPKILGGKESIPAVGGKGAESLDQIIQINNWDVETIGPDLLLIGELPKLASH